ncbi:MAG: DUF2207 domain-containing protein [Roseiflexaceae bacterium]|nr:DUF2207 domain-containing protein [Roseiflexaceae bacterium]
MLQRLFALALVALALAACGQPPKQFAWQQIDATVDVRDDGSLRVTEELTIRYISGSFSFLERDIPFRNLDSIDEFAVKLNGEPVPGASDGAVNTFSVERIDGVQRVRVNYQPTESGTRTITLAYTVEGAVQREYTGSSAPADERQQRLWWSMVFPQRDQPVERAIGRINLPRTLEAAQLQADAPDAAGAVERTASGASVQATNVAPGQELTLRLTFPRLIKDDALMRFYGSSGAAVNAALPVEEDSGGSIDPSVVLTVLFFVVVIGWNVYRWATGQADTGDYDGDSDSSSSSSHRRSRSSSSGSRSRSGGGSRGGRSGGGGGRVG